MLLPVFIVQCERRVWAMIHPQMQEAIMKTFVQRLNWVICSSIFMMTEDKTFIFISEVRHACLESTHRNYPGYWRNYWTYYKPKACECWKYVCSPLQKSYNSYPLNMINVEHEQNYISLEDSIGRIREW